MHHDVQDQWLLMQGIEVQNKRAGNEVAGNLAKHAFHVINSTLFGSRGTSSINSFSSGSSKISSPRSARFREDSNLDRVSISSENHDERTVPKVHLLRRSLLLQHLPAVPQLDINVSLFHTQRDSV